LRFWPARRRWAPLGAQSEEQLASFFQEQSKDVFLMLQLQSGKKVYGRFRSFDDYEEQVWIVQREEDGGQRQKGFRLGQIRAASLSAPPQATAKTKVVSSPDRDYQLLERFFTDEQ
jgi:hypothetical protein